MTISIPCCSSNIREWSYEETLLYRSSPPKFTILKNEIKLGIMLFWFKGLFPMKCIGRCTLLPFLDCHPSLWNVILFQKSNVKPMEYKNGPFISTSYDMSSITMALIITLWNHWLDDWVTISFKVVWCIIPWMFLIHPRKNVCRMDMAPNEACQNSP
jgi:hypothetical protein